MDKIVNQIADKYRKSDPELMQRIESVIDDMSAESVRDMAIVGMVYLCKFWYNAFKSLMEDIRRHS